MNLIEKYNNLADEKRWKEAIIVIREIIKLNPEIDTSWFNYGVCLNELGKYEEAADAFIKAHELNIKDYGIHYRIFHSLLLAEDYQQLYEFLEYLCLTFEEERTTIFESEEFLTLINRKEFIDLKKKYYNV
ncbi:MAG: hypothetical protein JW891_02765 [Candidatus Lokiarchaeota archaeon]|nr:hypothetical protein [Candidatus Lokiarchaeota archaeon]